MKIINLNFIAWLMMAFLSPLLSQTQDFTKLQGYLFDPTTTGPDSIGVGVANVLTLDGSDGKGVNIFDIESGWNLNHEDLPQNPKIQQVFGDTDQPTDHGTATLGILVGQDNGLGITGICPEADVKVGSYWDKGVKKYAWAIENARGYLDEGDILVLEIQTDGEMPIEFLSDARAEIESAVADSIIVIEAGGNDGSELSSSSMPWNDTGAIIVGAGEPDELVISTQGSNYGSKVHVHAWGRRVITSGFGDLEGSPEANDAYTAIFSGTSSATAIVAGVAASLQGIYKDTYGQSSYIGPKRMRNILINSGLPQSGTPASPIGPRVNLVGAVELLNFGSFVTINGDQQDASSNSFGRLEQYQYSQFISSEVPHDFLFLKNSSQTLRALQDLKPGTDEKFNTWQNISDLNHNTFNAPSSQEAHRATFKTAHDATLQSNNVTTGSSSDDIYFADPWLIDSTDSFGMRNRGMPALLKRYSPPLSIVPDATDPFKGVFLNEEPDPNDPDKPHYTVASPSFTSSGITYFLERWSGNQVTLDDPFAETTTLFFTGNNAIVTANIKGHLASGVSDALALNNQRKIVYDGSDYHLVYEDNGEIYYTSTPGSDNAWANEERVSDGSGQNAFPSLDVVNGIVVVVWQKEQASTGKIYLRFKDGSGWQYTEEVTTFFASSGFEATPVVATAGFIAFIVWHDFDSDELRIRSYDISEESFGAEDDIGNTNSNSLYPSLTVDTYTKLHLAWSESGNIYYSKISSSGGSYSFDISKENVSSGSGYYSNHVNPSITTDFNRRANIIWQAYSGPLQVESVLHRRRESSAWSNATGFTSGEWDYFKPSIMGFPNVSSNQKLRVTWRRSDNKIWLAKYNGSSWSDFYQSAQGIDPNLSANMSSDEDAKMVFRSSGSSPYQLSTTSNNLSKSTALEFVRHRLGVLSIAESEIAFEIGELEVDGESVEFYNYVDTLVVDHTGQWEEMFVTTPFNVSNQVSLNYFRAFRVLNRKGLQNALPPGEKIEYRLEVVDVGTGEVLAVPDVQKVKKDLPPDKHEHKSLIFTLPGSPFKVLTLTSQGGIIGLESEFKLTLVSDTNWSEHPCYLARFFIVLLTRAPFR